MAASTSMPNHPRSLAAPAGDVKHYPRSATRSEQLRRFEAIVCADPDLMRLLRRIRRIRLPQWRLVAGCLYQTVWNVLTGRPRGTGIRDYDLIYFDEDLSWAAEDAVIRRVAAAARGCVGPVETRNQARVHLWFESRFGSPYPRLSSADAAFRRYASAKSRAYSFHERYAQYRRRSGVLTLCFCCRHRRFFPPRCQIPGPEP